jgi:CRP/FNR family transcriptional regulator, cyclic AMP receptor protein
MSARFSTVVAVFDLDPDLLEHLDRDQRAAARSRAVAPVALLRPGERDPWRLIDARNTHLGILILEGLLTRNMTLVGRMTMELVGAGDIIRPWDEATAETSVPQTVTWTVHLPTRVALLDQRFAEGIAPWPGITRALLSRSARREQWLGRQLAILENPRVDARLLMLFWQLADRFGKVTPEGITIQLALTHEALGRLIGARRPTVTLALRMLGERGAIERRPDRSWIVKELPQDTAVTAAVLSDGTQPRPLEPEPVSSPS